MKEEGILALYRGTTPVMLRAFPANAVCILTIVENIVHMFSNILSYERTWCTLFQKLVMHAKLDIYVFIVIDFYQSFHTVTFIEK